MTGLKKTMVLVETVVEPKEMVVIVPDSETAAKTRMASATVMGTMVAKAQETYALETTKQRVVVREEEEDAMTVVLATSATAVVEDGIDTAATTWASRMAEANTLTAAVKSGAVALA